MSKHYIEFLICDIACLWRKVCMNALKELKITDSEKRALISIGRSPCTTQVDLAKTLEVEPQNLMRTIDSLEKKFLCKRQPCLKDRRVKQLVLTQQGKKLLREIHKITTKFQSQILTGIDETQQQQFIDTLLSINKNLNKFLLH